MQQRLYVAALVGLIVVAPAAQAGPLHHRHGHAPLVVPMAAASFTAPAYTVQSVPVGFAAAPSFGASFAPHGGCTGASFGASFVPYGGCLGSSAFSFPAAHSGCFGSSAFAGHSGLPILYGSAGHPLDAQANLLSWLEVIRKVREVLDQRPLTGNLDRRLDSIEDRLATIEKLAGIKPPADKGNDGTTTFPRRFEPRSQGTTGGATVTFDAHGAEGQGLFPPTTAIQQIMTLLQQQKQNTDKIKGLVAPALLLVNFQMLDLNRQLTELREFKGMLESLNPPAPPKKAQQDTKKSMPRSY